MHIRGIIFFLLVGLTASPVIAEDEADTFVKIKRPALWVPDLDRAILFYRDVLGFTLVSQGVLNIKEGSVLLDLFNTNGTKETRRALFSSSTEENALFVMETPDAPQHLEGGKRPATLVIQTEDLVAVETRARESGFTVGNTNREVSASSGIGLRETTIIGPGGQAVLVYEMDK